MGVVRAVRAAFGVCLCAAVVFGGTGVAHAGLEPDGSDVDFILEQIRKAEAHAAGGQLLGSGPNQISSVTLPEGLRTVNGRFNNIVPGQAAFGAADRVFPRLTDPFWRSADFFDPDGPAPGSIPGADTSYAQTNGIVADSHPRVISNLIVDQSVNNPAAMAARDTNPDWSQIDHDGDPDTPDQLVLPNVAPDTGLSAPFNAWFTFFGQFFDHGLDLVTKGGSGTVIVPLKEDDPLFKPGSQTNFMVLSRATNQKGPDGLLGTSDDVREHTNTTTPWVDQNQTYTSHPSHQVFLREYVLDGAGKPVATGKLLDRPGVGGLARWADVKAQARDILGIALDDGDVVNLPLVKTDDYGRFIPDPGTGFPQIVKPGSPVTFESGTPAAPVDASAAIRSDHAFLDDIAHHAAPKGDLDNNPETPATGLAADSTPGTEDDNDPSTYDDELLDAHFITGDGRGNENIGLTSVHHIFHAEHNLRVDEIKALIEEPGGPNPDDWKLSPGGAWNGERLFQAARFMTEMQYQHLVFEEFARKIQPQVNVFTGYQEEVDPAIVAEFAHTVYRFGHSMLTERMVRTNADGSDNSLGLIQAFLNPLEFNDGGSAGTLTPGQAAGSVVRGMVRERGNEIDEFVTGALRSNLLGLPLDLATINMARARDAGVPPLNEARRRFHQATGNSLLEPYGSWNDFKLGLRHQESLVNFIAAYGQHATIAAAETVTDKRNAAQALLSDQTFLDGPADQTGVDDIDFWVGGLAEKQSPFGGLLGSTFNFVFETQMEKLQDNDRLYYLHRTAGLNFLTQLEQNSFAEMIMRTTDTKHLPIDVFSRPDFTFELGNIGPGPGVQDDPGTPEWNEAELLTRSSNGTVRFAGAEHVLFGGTDDANRVTSSEGDDTVWGDGGDDRIEGGAGNDAVKGGTGNDIITDSFGDDGLDGGSGNDAINAGGGFDLILGGAGKDFVSAGSDPKETFAGAGDDFVRGGDSEDAIFGDTGDDWIEGGDGADGMLGDHGAPLQDDAAPGHDVLLTAGGLDDVHSEGGQDVMISGPGIARYEGDLGFDIVTHRGDSEPANDDLNRTALVPPNQEDFLDRFDFVEGASGWDRADVLRGSDATSVEMAGHELTDPGLFDGLSTIIGGASSFTGGDIMLGGDGSDLIEGRGGNDVLDGDKWLNVQISVRDAADPSIELQRANSMSSIQAAVFRGDILPSQLRIVREIKPGAPAACDMDTAVFSDVRAAYDLGTLSTELMTVNHNGGTQTDGVDTLRGFERLQFTDQTVEINPAASCNEPATGSVTVSDTSPTEGDNLTAGNTISDPNGVSGNAITYNWQSLADDNTWQTITTGGSFRPEDQVVGTRLRVEATFVDNQGGNERIVSAATDPVTNVNDAPSGRPLVGDTTPREGEPVSAHTGTISDQDGLAGVTFSYQWQANGGDIAGATSRFFTPTQAQVGQSLRVVVRYTDNHGTPERVESLGTSSVSDDAGPNEPDPPPAAPEPPAAAPPAGPGPASTPSDSGSDQPAVLRVSRLSVRVARSGRITVRAGVPEGARVMRIDVFQTRRAGAAARGRRIASIHKRVRGDRRYKVVLKHRRLRRLKPGRYVVDVRVGKARSQLGPASSKTFRRRGAAGRATASVTPW